MTDNTDALPPLPASQAFSLTRSVYTADQMRAYASAALASRDAEIAKLKGWRDAIDEALVVAHIGVATEPYDDLNKLLQWHHDIWLDPAVSSDAAALVEQGRAEIAKLRQGEPVALPNCTVADVGFRWDGDKQEHIPQVLVSFTPVPANRPNDDKGWKDRDAFAGMLASPPPAQPAQAERLEPCCGIPNECSGSGPCVGNGPNPLYGGCFEGETQELADLRRSQAAQIAALKTVMIAAAEEIASQWQAHCDAEGYGPQNLLRRLEEGIPSEYGYTAGAFAALTAERDALRADAERIDHLEKLTLRVAFQNNKRPTESVGSDLHMRDGRCSLYVRDLFGNAIKAECGYGESVREAIDAARASLNTTTTRSEP